MLPVCKYHGCGNDFIITCCSYLNASCHSAFAKRVCERSCGIGADGLILVKKQPLEMLIYNRDGSAAPMCGNGIRCFANYCYDEGICHQHAYDVKTQAGIQKIKVISLHPFVVHVDMGIPELNPEKLCLSVKEPLMDAPFLIDGTLYRISSVFIGTIHTVVFVSNLKQIDKENIGSTICYSDLFQERTNVNMVEVVDDTTLRVCTYERGVGLTLACGTGCCAAAWFAYRNGFCKHAVHVLLEKGELDIEVQDAHVYMRGQAEFIMKGQYQCDERYLSNNLVKNGR